MSRNSIGSFSAPSPSPAGTIKTTGKAKVARISGLAFANLYYGLTPTAGQVERGAMQVLPQTARQVGVTGNLYGEAGIEAGVRYLKLALALHRRDGWCAVASAYNSGVRRGPRCTRYGRAVVALAAFQ